MKEKSTVVLQRHIRQINKVAFVYLAVHSTSYVLTDDLGYAALRRPQLGLQYMCAVLEREEYTQIFMISLFIILVLNGLLINLRIMIW